MKRRKMPRGKDSHAFKAMSNMTRSVNIPRAIPRGGIRF